MVLCMRYHFAVALFVITLAEERTYTMRIEGCQWQEYTIKHLEVCTSFVHASLQGITGGTGVTADGLGRLRDIASLVVSTLC